MWIKTQTGALCNLANATDILIAMPRTGQPERVIALFAGDDQPETTLGRFETREEAQRLIDRIYDRLVPFSMQFKAA